MSNKYITHFMERMEAGCNEIGGHKADFSEHRGRVKLKNQD